MDTSAIEQLLVIASPALSPDGVGSSVARSEELASMLAIRNGFYAFESALHVLPTVSSADERGLDVWNQADVWRDAYPMVDDDWYFFGEDIFGGQFALGHDGVSCLDPESGQFARIADSIEGWARRVLDESVLTGWPLAHSWQAQNGTLRPGRRLIPKLPFVLGGAFDVANLYDGDTVASLRYRGDIATQIADLPDGASVRLRVVE